MDLPPPGSANLQSILQTLSAYAPAQRQSHSYAPDLEEGEYDPDEYKPSEPAIAHQPVNVQISDDPLHHQGTAQSNTDNAIPSRVIPPASSVKTWPKALNYTIRYICSDGQKMQRIQRLLEDQRKHERQWWTTREDMILKAQSRGESRIRLDSVLASLGGIIKTDRGNETREEGVDTELALFDQKVHRACIEMVDATTRELRNLDVPFFCKGFGDVTEEREKMAELRSQIVALLESYLKGGEEG